MYVMCILSRSACVEKYTDCDHLFIGTSKTEYDLHTYIRGSKICEKCGGQVQILGVYKGDTKQVRYSRPIILQ